MVGASVGLQPIRWGNRAAIQITREGCHDSKSPHFSILSAVVDLPWNTESHLALFAAAAVICLSQFCLPFIPLD